MALIIHDSFSLLISQKKVNVGRRFDRSSRKRRIEINGVTSTKIGYESGQPWYIFDHTTRSLSLSLLAYLINLTNSSLF